MKTDEFFVSRKRLVYLKLILRVISIWIYVYGPLTLATISHKYQLFSVLYFRSHDERFYLDIYFRIFLPKLFFCKRVMIVERFSSILYLLKKG